MPAWVAEGRTPPKGWRRCFRSGSVAEPWPEGARRCRRCGRPLPGSRYGRRPGIFRGFRSDDEAQVECLVDGPRGRRTVPPGHDTEWVLREATSLVDVLEREHEQHWSRIVTEGIERARGGSLEFLGHALDLLKTFGPAWLDRDRLESVIVAIGRLWVNGSVR